MLANSMLGIFIAQLEIMIEPRQSYRRNYIQQQAGIYVAVARYGYEYLAGDGVKHEEGG